MLESTGFTYAATPSSTYGIINCKVSGSGMFEEFFLPEKQIHETKVRGNPKPFLQGVEYATPPIIKLEFAFEDIWDTNKIRAVARWLNQDTYQPLVFDDFPNRIYYTILNSNSTLIHNGCQQGYLQLEMKCSSPFGYMPVASTPLIIGGTTIINNDGDLSIRPEISIVTINAGSVTITNSTTGKSFTISDLVSNETVYINNDSEQIITNLSNTWRYNSFTGDFIELGLNNNSIQITGSCTATLRYEKRVLQS